MPKNNIACKLQSENETLPSSGYFNVEQDIHPVALVKFAALLLVSDSHFISR